MTSFFIEKSNAIKCHLSRFVRFFDHNVRMDGRFTLKFLKHMCLISIYIALKLQVSIFSKTPPIIGKTIKTRPFFGYFFDPCPVFGQ